MLASFAVLLFCISYLAGTPDVQTFQELSKMDISAIIAIPLSFLKLVHSL